MGDFRSLRVWRAAQKLAIETHRVTLRMRGGRSGKLCDQLSRAAMSVPSNIVEGNGHASPREFARFLGYSVSSAWEVEGHAQLAHDLGMMNDADFARILELVIDVRKMLYGLLKKLGGDQRP